jgi:hypothetical protein
MPADAFFANDTEAKPAWSLLLLFVAILIVIAIVRLNS